MTMVSSRNNSGKETSSKHSHNSTKPPPPAVVEAQSRESTASASHPLGPTPLSPEGAASEKYKTAMAWNEQAVAAAKAALSSVTYAGPGGGGGGGGSNANPIDVGDDDIVNSDANNSPESKFKAPGEQVSASIVLPLSRALGCAPPNFVLRRGVGAPPCSETQKRPTADSDLHLHVPDISTVSSKLSAATSSRPATTSKRVIDSTDRPQSDSARQMKSNAGHGSSGSTRLTSGGSGSNASEAPQQYTSGNPPFQVDKDKSLEQDSSPSLQPLESAVHKESLPLIATQSWSEYIAGMVSLSPTSIGSGSKPEPHSELEVRREQDEGVAPQESRALSSNNAHSAHETEYEKRSLASMPTILETSMGRFFRGIEIGGVASVIGTSNEEPPQSSKEKDNKSLAGSRECTGACNSSAASPQNSNKTPIAVEKYPWHLPHTKTVKLSAQATMPMSASTFEGSDATVSARGFGRWRDIPGLPPMMSSLSMRSIGDEPSCRVAASRNLHRRVGLKKNGRSKREEDIHRAGGGKRFLHSCLKHLCLATVFVAIGVVVVKVLVNRGVLLPASQLEELESSQQDKSSNSEVINPSWRPTHQPTLPLVWTAKAEERSIDPENLLANPKEIFTPSSAPSTDGIDGDRVGDDGDDDDDDDDVTTETSTTSECVQCTNIPTKHMLSTNKTCATYSYAFERRCGTEFGWWGRNNNTEHCQYSCWANGVPFASQDGACCERNEADDDVAPSAIRAGSGDETTTDSIGVAPTTSLTSVPTSTPTAAYSGSPSAAPASSSPTTLAPTSSSPTLIPSSSPVALDSALIVGGGSPTTNKMPILNADRLEVDGSGQTDPLEMQILNANRLEVDGSGQTDPMEMKSQLPTTSAPSAIAFTHIPSFMPTGSPVAHGATTQNPSAAPILYPPTTGPSIEPLSGSPSKAPSASPTSVSPFPPTSNIPSCSGLSAEQYYRSHLEEGIDEATLSYLKSLDMFNLSWRIKVELRTNSRHAVETFGPENQFSAEVRMAAIRALFFWTRRGLDEQFSDAALDVDTPRHVKIVGTHSSAIDGLVELGLAFVSLHGMAAEEGIEEAKRVSQVIAASVPGGFENPIFTMHSFAYDMFGEAGVLIGDGMLEYLQNIRIPSEVPFKMAVHGRLASMVCAQLLHLDLGMPTILPSEDVDDTYQSLFADALGAYYMAHPLGGMLTGGEVCGSFLTYARSTGADVCESSPTISRPSKQLSSAQKECAAIWAIRWAWIDNATAGSGSETGVASLSELKDRFDARYERILNVENLDTCPEFSSLECMLYRG